MAQRHGTLERNIIHIYVASVVLRNCFYVAFIRKEMPQYETGA